MKRRTFIKGISASGVLAYTAGNANTSAPDWNYPAPDTLTDVVNADGYICVRIEFAAAESRSVDYETAVRATGADLVKIRPFFFASDDIFSADGRVSGTASQPHRDIVVVWLENAGKNSEILVNDDEPVRVSLDSILKQGTVTIRRGHLSLSLNFLLDHEIGKLELGDFKAHTPGKQFHIIAMADPQGGDAFAFDKLRTRMRIHNAFIEESVALVNRLPVDPLFSVVIGDIVDGWGYPEDFEQMRQYLRKLDMPVLYELGNHETENKNPFAPGYNMQLFNNYFAAQKRMNGTEKLLYSFDAGDWHFIVWPDPLRDGFWETHPHYFEWLKQDIKAHRDRPVMVFQHVPSHPVGINPMINYCESVSVKRLFLDTLAEHGNVKYILSGHVHIPVRASFKTAVSYKGMNLINLPAAGYRPRAFGESDWYGGPSQGVAVIEFNGRDAEIVFKCVTGEEYTFPKVMPEFDEKRYALWLNQKWDLPVQKQFINGEFTQGLAGWAQRYVYTEDENPANICKVRAADREHPACLYLYSRCRGYQAPGQDRWPQALNKVVQAIRLEPGETPLIDLEYKLDKENCDFNGVCGAYVWIEGFAGSVKLLNTVYSLHWVWYNMGGKAGLLRTVPPVQMDLNAEPGYWHHAVLNPKHDYQQFNEHKPFDTSNLDRLVMSIGTWNINDGNEQPFAVYIDRVHRSNGSLVSSVNGIKLQPKPKDKQWWRSKLTPFTHTAGEHRYVLEMQRKYKPEQE